MSSKTQLRIALTEPQRAALEAVLATVGTSPSAFVRDLAEAATLCRDADAEACSPVTALESLTTLARRSAGLSQLASSIEIAAEAYGRAGGLKPSAVPALLASLRSAPEVDAAA